MQLQSKARQLTPAGAHTATCFQLVDIGTQKIEIPGKEIKYERQFVLSWELSDELMADGRPLAFNKFYTNSAHVKSNIVQHLKSWLGAIPADMKDVLGKSGTLTIVHELKESGDVREKMGGIAPLKKNEKAPPLVNNKVFFDLDEFTEAAFAQVPEWLQNKIKLSPEYAEIVSGNGPQAKPYTCKPLSPSQAMAKRESIDDAMFDNGQEDPLY